MLDVLNGVSAISQKIEISKAAYDRMIRPPNNGIIAYDQFLIKVKKDKNNNYFAYPFSYRVEVIKQCILENNQAELVLEYFNGYETAVHSFSCSILDPKEVRQLLNYGILFETSSTKELIAYLMRSMQKAPVVHLYRHLGWSNDADNLTFFWHKPISNSEKYRNWVYDGDLLLSSKGSLSVWTNMVREQVAGNAALTFVLAAGFASSILALLNDKYDLGSIVVSLANETSRGKTTAAMLAVSPYACPKINCGTLKSMFATPNALVSVLGSCSGLTVAFDELGASGMDSKGFTKLLYNLSSGAGKLRLNSNAELKKAEIYSSVIITTGEFPLLDEEAPGGLRSGRVIEISDDLTTSSVNSDIIRSTVLENFSVSGERFLDRLIDFGTDKLYQLYDKAVAKLQDYVHAQSTIKDRIISKFAVLWITEHLMNKWFDFNINQKKFLTYIIKLANKSMLVVTPEDRLLDIIIEEATKFRYKFSQNGSSPLGACIGEINVFDSYKEIIIYKSEFEDITRKHNILNSTSILKSLRRKGVLKSEVGRLENRVKGRAPFYKFHIDIDKSENSSDDNVELFEED